MGKVLYKTEAQFNTLSLDQWANLNYLNKHVPVWVTPVLSMSDKLRMFDLKRVAARVFEHELLNGRETTPLEFVLKGGVALNDTPHVSYHRKKFRVIWNRAIKLSGVQGVAEWKPVKHSSTTDHPWAGEYRKYLTSSGNTRQSVVGAVSAVNQLFRLWLPILKKYQDQNWLDIKLYTLTRTDVQMLINVINRKVQSGEYARSYGNQVIWRLLAFFRFCRVRFGIANVTEGIKGQRDKAKLDFWLPDQAQMRQFFEIVKAYSPRQHRDLALFGTMYLQGLRPEEARGIQWGDIDLGTGELNFRAKGGDHDQLPLVSSLMAFYQLMKYEDDSTKFVFVNENGRQLSPEEMRMIFRVYATIAGWPEDTSLRIFRHAFCTHLLINTGDYYMVNQLARHRTFSMTETYLHRSKMEYLQTANELQKSLVFDAYNTLKGGIKE